MKRWKGVVTQLLQVGWICRCRCDETGLWQVDWMVASYLYSVNDCRIRLPCRCISSAYSARQDLQMLIRGLPVVLFCTALCELTKDRKPYPSPTHRSLLFPKPGHCQRKYYEKEIPSEGIHWSNSYSVSLDGKDWVGNRSDITIYNKMKGNATPLVELMLNLTL